MRAIEVNRHGGPEVLRVVDIEEPNPGLGQVLVDVGVAGVNYMDIYMREGTEDHWTPTPFILGGEGAGRVIGIGEGVIGFRLGDRVAWKDAPGSYAGRVLVDAEEAIQVPDGVSEETAAAILLQGLTAHYLATSVVPIEPEDDVLVHAAAGGVGLLLTQLVKMRGGRVIATVSSEDKEASARAAGADEVIRYDMSPTAPEVRRLTGGAGVKVVFDAVGRSTFDASLASLRARGCLVLYGASSGPVPPFDLLRLRAGGSLAVTRPSLPHYTRTREELMTRVDELFDWLRQGRLRVNIGKRYPFSDARGAHQDLEGRRSVGKLLLLPD